MEFFVILTKYMQSEKAPYTQTLKTDTPVGSWPPHSTIKCNNGPIMCGEQENLPIECHIHWTAITVEVDIYSRIWEMMPTIQMAIVNTTSSAHSYYILHVCKPDVWLSRRKPMLDANHGAMSWCILLVSLPTTCMNVQTHIHATFSSNKATVSSTAENSLHHPFAWCAHPLVQSSKPPGTCCPGCSVDEGLAFCHAVWMKATCSLENMFVQSKKAGGTRAKISQFGKLAKQNHMVPCHRMITSWFQPNLFPNHCLQVLTQQSFLQQGHLMSL